MQGSESLGIRQAASLQDSVFLKACRREKTPYTPVWLMRQAGRYMKDYRELREQHTFLELCKNPSLAADITVHAQRTLGVDAAILFSDILLILEPMGLQLDYVKGDGPSITNAQAPNQPPLQTSAAVDRLRVVDPQKSLSFVMEAVRASRAALPSHIPLIGFSGAPFTVASYIIEGGSSTFFSNTKEFMKADWMRWDVLMRKLVESTARYLNAQIDSGVQAVQIFDSWAGALDAEEYRRFAMPFTRLLIERLKNRVPVIHFGTKTVTFLEAFAEAGGDVIGIDHRMGLDEAWMRIGHSKAIQGNMDPRFVLTGGVAMEMEVRRVLEQAGGRPGHIFNLGHGVLPETPPENVQALVGMVHEYKR